jgi:hypothetical protein
VKKRTNKETEQEKEPFIHEKGSLFKDNQLKVFNLSDTTTTATQQPLDISTTLCFTKEKSQKLVDSKMPVYLF